MIGDTIFKTQLLINGESRNSSDGNFQQIFSPSNGKQVGEVAQASEKDVNEAVESAEMAFNSWSKMTAYERLAIIKKATEYASKQADEIGMLMALEQGKPFAQSRKEVLGSCSTIEYFADEGVRIEGYTNQTEKANIRSWVSYHPVGVCALLTPWNYPLALLSWKLGPALAAGCTVVVKPTEVTPMAPTAFCKALTEGGIPAGVINVINGDGLKVGSSLVQNPGVKKVAMTGSTATGKKLMEMYGPTLNKISLELGGHCPAIVCKDADVDLAAKIISYKGFRNMGQSCSTVNRVYAHESVHDEFVLKLKELAEGHSLGDGVTDGSVDLGPMATKGCVERVELHVKDAIAKGAELVTGGSAPAGEKYNEGNYYLPTVLTGMTHDMLMAQEETFGPVVPIAKFDDLSDAVAMANDTNFGLVSYLFTRDFKTTMQLSEELEAGTICVNNGAVNTNYAPYAGWKDSGFGLELSRKSIFEYLNTKHTKIAY